MTTKELVQAHDKNKAEDGVLHLVKVYTRKMFREHLNAEAEIGANDGINAGGHASYRNHVFGNRKRAYGDYLYHQDRDMFEDNYRCWLSEKKNEAGKLTSEKCLYCDHKAVADNLCENHIDLMIQRV